MYGCQNFLLINCNSISTLTEKELNGLMDELFEAYGDIDGLNEADKEFIKAQAQDSAMWVDIYVDYATEKSGYNEFLIIYTWNLLWRSE